MKGELVALSVGKPSHFSWKNREIKSGIGKDRVNEALLQKESFIGDGVANPEYHGGLERAVCAYPFEHYAQWEKEFGVALQVPAFGENICVTNMLEENIYIGDTFSLGDSIIQVTQGRVPCSTISKFNQVDELLNRVFETGFTGYFFRVLKEGKVKENSELTLINRTQENITVLYANQIMFHERDNVEAMERILQVEGLAKAWHDTFTQRIAKKVEN